MAFADRLIELFSEAKALPAGDRTRLVEEACGDDQDLREQLLVLLRAHDKAGDFLQPAPLLLSNSPANEQPGDRIGRYKLREPIGEGGCGIVYMADQEEPVRRRVALKVIKLGMDTKSVIARFEAERQALALMDHPNIAKVLDAGATDAGRPYFVMELVCGVRITDYCDQNHLSTEERLKLFIQVCNAVQHAHQKGIIHRDLKPSNILVTLHDGVPVPKVIDFGVAKATQERLTDLTVYTQVQQIIGTPLYMSPEQAELNGLDVDTRTDIYALGVLLYELLTGRTPFDAETLHNSSYDEMRRFIREEEPQKPSTALHTMAEGALRNVAQHRASEPPKLIHAIRGDLDWIVMKTLEKDRARRYETASGLAADVQRHLSNEPVVARPPGATYRFQKLVRRNKLAFAAGSAVVAALLVALFILATGNARIRQEQTRRDDALRDRSAALEAAREQLRVSLESQAEARRHSGQMGQRTESLAALEEAARIRPTPELRDSAIAALALPDVELGPAWGIDLENTLALAYDSLNHRYAYVGLDSTISIRSLPGDRELQRLKFMPRVDGVLTNALNFTFSPDGRFLAWLQGGKLEIWRWESGELVLKSPPEKCSTLAFSPDSRRIAVGHDDRITCFDLGTGDQRHHWPAGDRIWWMDFHPDGRRLAVGYQSSPMVAVYNSDDGERTANIPAGPGSQTVVAWHPDGDLLAAGSADGRIQIWNMITQIKVAVLEGHAQNISLLAFHAGGDLLISKSWDGTMRLWQPSPGRLLMRLPFPAGLMGSSPAGRWAGVILPSNHQVQLWGIVPGREYHTFLNTFGAEGSAASEGDISPDGSLLALGAADGVRLWDVARGRELAWLRMGPTWNSQFRANGRELLTSGRGEGLRRWPVETKAVPGTGLQTGPPHQIALPFAPTRIAISPDDRTLAIVGEDAGRCALLDLATETVRVSAMPHANACFVALSPDARRSVSSGWGSASVKLWDGSTGRLLNELERVMRSQVYFTPDNQELIVARGHEFTFHTLDSLAVSRRLPREGGVHPGFVSFTADGKMMAMEMAPGVIHLKETTSGRTVAKLEDPLGDVSTWMGFTPDGAQLIVAARYAGAIHRWDLRAIRARLKAMNLAWEWPEF
jgi:WD40 repeat protein/tRNA A-37 threonylcarbamoyl transferase component Bud32